MVEATQEGGTVKVQTHRSRTHCAGNPAQIQFRFTRFFLIPATSLPIEFEETKDKSIDFSPINLGAQPTKNPTTLTTSVLTSQSDWGAT